MMIDDRFRKYEPFFGKWHLGRELGKGSFGQVFEIYWDDEFGKRSFSALKMMHIPSDEALSQQMESQPDTEAVRRYFYRQVERIRDEIDILQQCKGHSNIVSYEDHLIRENAEGKIAGWDILIRMELLYPVSAYLAREGATQYDVVCMWRDIANALIYCDEQGIIHRDIKPGNILVSDQGRFKLSDFGAAKNAMQGEEASTRIGTERYMAPEVYKGQKYDKRADYYSLGCLIFYYFNFRRHPFLPDLPEEVDFDDYNRAQSRRISGEKIPSVRSAGREVNKVLQKCLAYKPQDRYKSAYELHRSVIKLLADREEELKKKALNPTDERQNLPKEKIKQVSTVFLLTAAGILFSAGFTALLPVFKANQATPYEKTQTETEIKEAAKRTKAAYIETEIAETVIAETVIPEIAFTETEIMEAVISETEIAEADARKLYPQRAGLTKDGMIESGLTETDMSEAGTIESGLTETDMSETGMIESGLTETDMSEAGTIETCLTETDMSETGKAENGLADIIEDAPSAETESDFIMICPDSKLTVDAYSIKAHILVNSAAEDVDARLILTDCKARTRELILDLKQMRKDALEKYAASAGIDIEEAAGYEIRQKIDTQLMADGECTARLMGYHNRSEEYLLKETVFVKELNTAFRETEGKKSGFVVISDEEGGEYQADHNAGYVIGIDPVPPGQSFNPSHIMLQVWMSQKNNVLPNVFLTGIDSERLETGTADERGYIVTLGEPVSGSPNSLPQEIQHLFTENEYREGRMVRISIPSAYLPDGRHTLSFRFAMGTVISEEFSKTVDIDSTVPVPSDYEP